MTAIELNPRVVFRWHVAIAALLVLAHVIVFAVALLFNIDDLPGLNRFFNLRASANPADFFASLALLATAAAAFWARTVETASRARLFFALAAGVMLLLAVEELVEAHSVVWRFRDMPAALVALGAGALAIVAAVGLGFAATMTAIDRRTCLHLALGGLVYVFGVLGEILVVPVIWAPLELIIPSWAGVGVIATAITEGLEMLGVAFILRTLLFHAARRGARLSLGVFLPPGS